MGYVRHHAIVVTGLRSQDIAAAREKAMDLGMAVSAPVGPTTNGTLSFLIAPDGSKEGWSESNDGNGRREAFKAWCRAHADCYIHWAEVQYGDDDGVSLLVDHSDQEFSKGDTG